MATFPSIDFSKLDMPNVDTEKIVGVLRDAAYVVIGVGVVTVQQAQARRREFVAAIRQSPVAEQLGTTRTQVEKLIADLETQFAQLDERFQTLETKLDTAVGKLEARLPEQAGVLLGQAHEAAKAARKQVRGLLRNAA